MFVASLSALRAQTTAGNMMAGGTFDISSSKNENSTYKSTGITVAPSFGYFISDRLAIGAYVPISSTTNGTGNAKVVNTSFGIAPFARYYKFTSSENFAFFAQANIGYTAGTTNPAVGATTKSNALTFSIQPGFTYFFNKHWAAELILRGLVIQSTDPNTSTNNDKTTTVEFDISSLSPSLGLRYYFGN